VLFYNAYHIKNQCIDTIKTYNSGDVQTLEAAHANRNWSVAGEKRAARLRLKADIVDEPVQIRTVVIDMTSMHNVDTTGLTAMKDLKADIERYAGKGASFRLVGLNERVRERFARFGWALADAGCVDRQDPKETLVYESVEDAVFARQRSGSDEDIQPVEVMVVGSDKEKV
jgi:sodium-independent sulfate anion transporter 11